MKNFHYSQFFGPLACLAAALGPLACLAAALGPLACLVAALGRLARLPNSTKRYLLYEKIVISIFLRGVPGDVVYR